MKIVQINAVNEFSSTGRMTRELHEYLLSQGMESYIAACNVKDTNNTIKIGNTLDYKIHALKSRIFGRQGFYSRQSTNRLIKTLSRIKPDIIHLHNLHANYINLPLLIDYISTNNIATVITLHDCWSFTGHCCYFTDSNCEKWKLNCGQCQELKKWNPSWFFDRSSQNLQDKKELFSKISNLAVIGVSDWVTNFVHDSILSSSKIIKRIYNWIDVDVFKPKSINKLRSKYGLENKFVILGVSHAWSLGKGLFDFINLAQLRPDLTFVLVGSMPTNVTLPNNIISVGVINNSEKLAEYYSMADVFFNPSIRETFGLVTVEAMACGIPVIVYNATATPELVPSFCGEIVPIKSFEDTINAIQHIKETRLDRAKIAEHIHQNFNREFLCREYLEVYKNLATPKI